MLCTLSCRSHLGRHYKNQSHWEVIRLTETVCCAGATSHRRAIWHLLELHFTSTDTFAATMEGWWLSIKVIFARHQSRVMTEGNMHDISWTARWSQVLIEFKIIVCLLCRHWEVQDPRGEAGASPHDLQSWSAGGWGGQQRRSKDTCKWGYGSIQNICGPQHQNPADEGTCSYQQISIYIPKEFRNRMHDMSGRWNGVLFLMKLGVIAQIFWSKCQEKDDFSVMQEQGLFAWLLDSCHTPCSTISEWRCCHSGTMARR